MLSYSTEQCLTKLKDVDVVWKRRDLSFPPPPPKALFMGFRWWQGGLYEPYPNCLNLLGQQISGYKFHENRRFFPRIWGWGVTKISCTSCLPLEMIQKLYFRISVPGLCWNLDIQMCAKKGHVSIYSHSPKYLPKGTVHIFIKLSVKTHARTFHVK